jgi:hypothetical protein
MRPDDNINALAWKARFNVTDANARRPVALHNAS